MGRYDIAHAHCPYKTELERLLEANDYFMRHPNDYRYYFDCGCFCDKQRFTLECDNSCPYYREHSGDVVNNKFTFEAEDILIFKSVKTLNVNSLLANDVVKIYTKTKSKSNVWYGKVAKVTDKTVTLLVYDGPNVGRYLTAKEFDARIAENKMKRLSKYTIEYVAKIDLLDYALHRRNLN